MRRAESPGGNRLLKKRKPVAERRQEIGTMASPPLVARITGRIPGLPGPERVLT